MDYNPNSKVPENISLNKWVRTRTSVFPIIAGFARRVPFLGEYKTIHNVLQFSKKGFKYVYPPKVLLSQINLIGEPVVRRVLLDDYKRTFPKKKEDYKESLKALLMEQIKALEE